MKKLLLALLLVFVLAVPVMASSLSTEVLPGLEAGLIGAQAGMYWERKSETLREGVQAPVLDFKNLVSLDAGTLTNLEGTPPFILGLNLNINKLAELLGLGYHLPANSQIGVWRGWDFSLPKGAGRIWGFNWVIPLK